MTSDVTDDRRVVLTLPPEVPTGMAELVVTVGPHQGRQSLPTGVSVFLISRGSGDKTQPIPERALGVKRFGAFA